MLSSVCDLGGVVHLNPANENVYLCGRMDYDLYGQVRTDYSPTSDQVTFPHCAKVICAVKYEPFNTIKHGIASEVLMKGIMDAARKGGEDDQA